jgi:hypothetical protein
MAGEDLADVAAGDIQLPGHFSAIDLRKYFAPGTFS